MAGAARPYFRRLHPSLKLMTEPTASLPSSVKPSVRPIVKTILNAGVGHTNSRIRAALPPNAVSITDLARCPYFQTVLEAFPFELYSVRLMALTPGSVIKPHRDNDLSIEDGFARFHIPLKTNPNVSFLLNNQPVNMKVGELWYLRLSDIHSVKNQGEDTRVHMVIDAPVTPEMTNLMGLEEMELS